MTQKNIFAYKLFLSLNISDFNLFFMWKLQSPLKKVTLLFPSNSSLKVEILSSPLFLKIWLEAQPPPPPSPSERGEGCTLWLFGIMRHNSFTLFLAETLYTFSKSSLSKYKFGEIPPEQSKVWNFALWWVPFVKIK